MTPEINGAIIQAYGIPGLIVAYLVREWWISRKSRYDPMKELFDKLDRIEMDLSSLRGDVKQMDQRDDHIHDRLLRMETRDEMRGR